MNAAARDVLVLAILLAASVMLSGCQSGCVGATLPAERTAVRLSGHSGWFDRAEEVRFQGGMAVRTPFAKVPLIAFITIDAPGHVAFVGLSDWGMRLAEASVTLEDPAPAQLQASLTRIPKLASRLSLALTRIFLVWPGHGDYAELLGKNASREQPITPAVVRYGFDAETTQMTEKKGRDRQDTWCVSMLYGDRTSPEALPVEIIYRAGGLEIVLQLKELAGHE